MSIFLFRGFTFNFCFYKLMQSSLYDNNNMEGLVNSECLRSYSISTVHTHRKLNAFMFEHVSERNVELPCLSNLTDSFKDKFFWS